MNIIFVFLGISLCLAAEPGTSLDSHTISQLGGRLIGMMAQEPALKNVLDDAIARSKSSSLPDFLSKIHLCDPAGAQYGAVNQTSEQQLVILGRSLEEPEAGADLVKLKAFYQQRYSAELKDKGELDWNFEPDLAVLSRHEVSRQICVKPGSRIEVMADALAHEAYHYVKIPVPSAPADILSYKDLDDYAARTVLAPGEEIDAYVFQYGIAIRREGLAVLGRGSKLAGLFSTSGEFTGARDDLLGYVLEDLGYRKSRFTGEYRSLLDTELQRTLQRRQVLAELLKGRGQQSAELGALVPARNRFLNFVWPSYRDETQRLTKLLAGAKGSRERLAKSIEQCDARATELRSRLGS